MRELPFLILITFGLLLNGCKKKSSSAPEAEVQPMKLVPGKVSLNLPDNNSVCATGTVISETQSAITLSWAPSVNTTSYLVAIKNLLTQTIRYKQTNNTQITDTLIRSTPYSWFIVSKSKELADTTKSEVWKFYNAGPGAVSYAPYPAEITYPGAGQIIVATGNMINLQWKGSSIDNNITGYDIYLGTTANPGLYRSNVTDMFLNNVSVGSGNTYYWKIVTKDLIGNSSTTGIFSFKVN